MLKAKSKVKESRNKTLAMSEVEKEDMNGLYAKVPARLTKKLKVYLAENDITLTEWLEERIEEI